MAWVYPLAMPAAPPFPMTMPADGLQPDWPAPASVRALCTTRAGGQSVAPFESFNLGLHVGDDAHAVQANRRQLAERLGARPVFLDQVHGTGQIELRADTPDGLAADASFTTAHGLACTVMVADCLPLLFTTADGRCVGAAHAGWRGLAAGVLAPVLAQMRGQAAAAGGDTEVLAWLGPCIGPTAFEVGPEVREAFVASQPAAEACFQPRGAKFLANLPALARLSLQAQGVNRVYGNDGSPPWCTVSQPSRFFSFRRDGRSGRFAACIWRV